MKRQLHTSKNAKNHDDLVNWYVTQFKRIGADELLRNMFDRSDQPAHLAKEVFEKLMYLHLYETRKLNKTKCADALGVSRNTFYARLDKWNIA